MMLLRVRDHGHYCRQRRRRRALLLQPLESLELAQEHAVLRSQTIGDAHARTKVYQPDDELLDPPPPPLEELDELERLELELLGALELLELLGALELDELLGAGAVLELDEGAALLDAAGVASGPVRPLSQAMDRPPTATAPHIIFRNSRRSARSFVAA